MVENWWVEGINSWTKTSDKKAVIQSKQNHWQLALDTEIKFLGKEVSWGSQSSESSELDQHENFDLYK